MFKIKIFALFLLLSSLAATHVSADMIYTSSAFNARVVLVNNATTYSVQTNVTEGGVQAGTLIATLTYGGGTNPFANANWSPGASFVATGASVNDAETNETADGVWEFSLTPLPGWQIDGMTLFTSGTVIGNPIFENITSTGVATVYDDNEGLANELISNFADGDIVPNGSDIIFNTGTLRTGITVADHTQNWSYDSAGANYMSFTYRSGPVTNISNEGIRFDAQFSVAPVPEPSSVAIFGLLAGVACLRRRR
jgi:hypothetical protein